MEQRASTRDCSEGPGSSGCPTCDDRARGTQASSRRGRRSSRFSTRTTAAWPDGLPCSEQPVTAYRLHPTNTTSAALYRGTLGVTKKHLPEATGLARRLLLERRLDALWGLGEFGTARAEARRAVRTEPALLRHPRFV